MLMIGFCRHIAESAPKLSPTHQVRSFLGPENGFFVGMTFAFLREISNCYLTLNADGRSPKKFLGQSVNQEMEVIILIVLYGLLLVAAIKLLLFLFSK